VGESDLGRPIKGKVTTTAGEWADPPAKGGRTGTVSKKRIGQAEKKEMASWKYLAQERLQRRRGRGQGKRGPQLGQKWGTGEKKGAPMLERKIILLDLRRASLLKSAGAGNGKLGKEERIFLTC